MPQRDSMNLTDGPTDLYIQVRSNNPFSCQSRPKVTFCRGSWRRMQTQMVTLAFFGMLKGTISIQVGHQGPQELAAGCIFASRPKDDRLLVVGCNIEPYQPVLLSYLRKDRLTMGGSRYRGSAAWSLLLRLRYRGFTFCTVGGSGDAMSTLTTQGPNSLQLDTKTRTSLASLPQVNV